MPLYDYQCQKCQSLFEIFASFKEKKAGLQPECPQCHSQETRQIMTAGILHGSANSPASKPSGCGPNSGPGCCA